MAVALASMASSRAVDPSVAMTGEVTLTGQVLPVGGIKEKVLAARAAGITHVFLPDRNEADVDEIRGDDILEGLEFAYVEHVSAVLGQVLLPVNTRRPAHAGVKAGGVKTGRAKTGRARAATSKSAPARRNAGDTPSQEDGGQT